MQMPPKRIVMNALSYKQDSSGIGVMIRELFFRLAALSPQECAAVLSKDSPVLPRNLSLQEIRSPYNHSQGLRRMLFQTVIFGRQYCRDALLLTTDSKTPFFLPSSCRLVPLVTDLAVYRMGNVYKLSRTLWWKLQYRYVRRKAVHYIAISAFTKGEMVKILGIAPEKIDIVPCACDPAYVRVTEEAHLAALRRKYGLSNRVILFVGNNNPRKNLSRTIQAFDAVRRASSAPLQLVIAGEQGWKFDRAQALAGIEFADDVRFLGFVPDADMPALYSAASVFAFPTLYEGFGIPVLEAQQCGVPVLTSNTSSLPEVGGNGALYVNPKSVEEIAQGMCSLLENDTFSQQLVARGYENAQRFSWERSAEKLNEIVERVMQK